VNEKIQGITDYIEAVPDMAGSVRLTIGNNATDEIRYIDLSPKAAVDFGGQLAAATLTASGFPASPEEIKVCVVFRAEDKEAEAVAVIEAARKIEESMS
jgi:hypothetical protein